MKDDFPQALAISFIDHQLVIELYGVTEEEHWKRINSLPGGFWVTDVTLRYHNGPLHGRDCKRPKPITDMLQDDFDGTDYLKSKGSFHPGSMMSCEDNTLFTAGIQVTRHQEIGVTVPLTDRDKKLESEYRLGRYTVKQRDWENGTACRMETKRILRGGIRVAGTNKPFNNRFLDLKGKAANLLHSDNIRNVSEVFWTTSFVSGPHPLASIGKRVFKIGTNGNDFFSDPDALPISGEYTKHVQGIFISSLPPVNRNSKIQDGICGAPIIRARKDEPLNPHRTRAKVAAAEARETPHGCPSSNTPLTVIQKRPPQEETTGEVAGFMDIQYGGDRLLCFADTVGGLVDDGWLVVPVYAETETES